MSFGELLRMHRKDAGLTQESLARKSGLCLSCVCSLEQGRGKLPSIKTASKLAKALNVPLTSLVLCEELAV